ncbi:MAG TPA: hypothetical protein VLM11_08080 [Streptosporangiaceae bacterium]|nr:hypothetical protein [Streptosporangiaceae bacterium]
MASFRAERAHGLQNLGEKPIVSWIPLADVPDMVDDGQIQCASTATALLLPASSEAGDDRPDRPAGSRGR